MVRPHLRLFRESAQRDVIAYDVRRWVEQRGGPTGVSLETQLTRLLVDYPEFRNLFYHRIGSEQRLARAAALRLARRLLQPLPTLYLWTHSIGPGLIIFHGFSTVIGARSIGRDCTVFQQVTIGYTGEGASPTIGDEVTVFAGALVLGDITLGDGCRVGAGAVVVDDVPAGVTVVGPKARPTGRS
jgi:serine O-acetyltransferase